MRKEENAMEQNKPEVEQIKPEFVQIKPDWTINDLYKNAWKIVKNNKILWLFGMAMGAGASGNYSNSFDGKDFESLFKIFEKTPKESSDLTQVLGSSTSAFSDAITSLFASILPSYYIILGFEIFILIIVGIITSIIYSSWAHGALLEGIQTASEKGKLSIRDLSEKAFGSIKSVTYVSYIPYLLLGSGAFILFAIFGILAIALPDNSRTLLMALIPIFTILLLVAFSVMTIMIIWAVRIVVIDKKPAKLALRMGYKIAKKKFWASALLGIVNTITIALIYIIILLPILGIIVGGAFTISQDTYLGTGIIVIGAVFLLVFIFAESILGGIINAFKATVWSLAYNAIKGKYEK